jgi:Inner membrane protein YgaP-like, transmembrane domain
MANLFKQDTGKVDRIIPVIVGALLVGNVFIGLQTVVGWIGLILIVTGLFGTCPVYSLLGINTKTMGEKVGLG